MTWTLAQTWTHSTNVANVDFTDLGSYQDLLLVARDITSTVSAFKSVRLSVDNGSTFYSSAGNYGIFSGTGTFTTTGQATGISAANTAARSFFCYVLGSNVTSSTKLIINNLGQYAFIASSNPVDAMRVDTSAGNISGGTILVYGRT